MKLTFWTLVLAFAVGLTVDRFLLGPISASLFGKLMPTTTA